jgi:NADPH2:quinone reductase
MLLQGITAHNCLIEWGCLEPGETVLINAAAGGVGTMAVQIANARGATVVGTASTETKLDLVSELGADYLIQYTEEDIPESVTERVRKGAVDLVLDGVGGQAFKNSMDVLASGGTMVSYGVASGRPPTVTTPRLYYRNLTLKGYHMLRASETMYDQVIEGLDNLYQLIENGEVEPVIGDTYPLSEASQVHEAMINRSTTGRPVLIPE